MTNSDRFKFPKRVVFGITILYLVLILLTYLLLHKEPIELCAKRMMSAQVVALLFQCVLNYVNYRSKDKIIILATLFVSAAIMAGAIVAFMNLPFLCEYYSY
ncbi:MAG TPA: hypothetical protein VK050_07295 [Flavobacteriaceae bacterium]|nr:hypothetical protein [Flavobacteriaceae bacterium]